MRNFWIEVEIDGRKTMLKGGPRNKDGGFDLKLYQRQDGHSVCVLELRGVSYDEDKLETHISYRSINDMIATRR